MEYRGINVAYLQSDAVALQNYFNIAHNYIEPFSELYEKLDFESFFGLLVCKGNCKTNGFAYNVWCFRELKKKVVWRSRIKPWNYVNG